LLHLFAETPVVKAQHNRLQDRPEDEDGENDEAGREEQQRCASLSRRAPGCATSRDRR
jgi:hypothetical protein